MVMLACDWRVEVAASALQSSVRYDDSLSYYRWRVRRSAAFVQDQQYAKHHERLMMNDEHVGVLVV
jgi:hypothetical protein